MTRSLPAAVAKARAYAVEVHGDQKYGVHPYSFHLDAVDYLLVAAGYRDDLELRQVGFLHDVVEDTATDTTDLIAAGFSPDVASAVGFTTDAEGHNRKTRKAATYARMERDRLRLAGGLDEKAYRWIKMGMVAKLVDRLTNIAESHVGGNAGLADMYWKERDTFRSALYLAGVADYLWSEYDGLLAVRPPKPRRGGR